MCVLVTFLRIVPGDLSLIASSSALRKEEVEEKEVEEEEEEEEMVEVEEDENKLPLDSWKFLQLFFLHW